MVAQSEEWTILDETQKEVLITNLLDGWEGALRNVDIYWQIVKDVPNYKEQLEVLRQDSFLEQSTKDRFALVRDLAERLREGDLSSSQIEALSEATRKGIQ